MAFRVDFKWVDAGQSVDQLSSATMAELVVAVDEVALTSHVDHELHSHGDELTVPLYPIAEWLTSWWWPIFHEYGDWSVELNSDYLQRHDMAFAAGGFAYPSILLQPTGKFLEVRSRRVPRQHSPIEFIGEVISQIPVEAAKTEFAKLVLAVIEKLRRKGLQGSQVETDWEAMGALTQEELVFSKAAGQFGFDPFDTREGDAASILRLANLPEGALKEDLFSLGPPSLAEELLGTIRTASLRADEKSSGTVWTHLAKSKPLSFRSAIPWKTGYEIANWARKQLHLDGEPVSFDADKSVAVVDLAANSSRLMGVVGNQSPACAIRPVVETARRFAMARAVGDFLMREETGPSLLTSMRTDRQSRTRAFAAEFLAPSDGIRRRLGSVRDRWVDNETVDELANEFNVSTQVIANQIRNHHLGVVQP